MTESQRQVAISRMRRYVRSWSAAELAEMASDRHLPPIVRAAIKQEIRERSRALWPEAQA